MLSRYKGVVVIERYDQDGKKLSEIAKPEFEDRFSWFLFSVIITLSLALIGQVI